MEGIQWTGANRAGSIKQNRKQQRCVGMHLALKYEVKH